MTVRLHRFAEPDIPVLLSWLPDEAAVMQWGGPLFDYPVTTEALQALIEKHEGEYPPRECWSVVGADVAEAAAPVGHFQIAYDDRTGEGVLGRVIVAPEQRGRGFAALLLNLATERAFSRPGLHRLELRVYDHNASAIAAYRRAGFVWEGVRRQSVPVGDERWNTALMSMLRGEFCRL